MEFPYIKSEGNFRDCYRPCLPISFSNNRKEFRVGHALVDTGSDFTILPLEVAHQLEIELDDSKEVLVDGAGGGRFKVIPSRNKIGCIIELEKYRSIRWKATVYFAETEPIILLSHLKIPQLQ